MPHYKVAHLLEQGQNMIIVPLEASFDNQTTSTQQATIKELQGRAGAAGLAGTVVPVWDSGSRMKFIAPQPWHPFFQSLSMPQVMASINKEIHW
jgi:hypothetical protein